MTEVKALYNHLQASGSGETKLKAVAACDSVADALKALGPFPGTLAKAQAFVASRAPVAPPAAPVAPVAAVAAHAADVPLPVIETHATPAAISESAPAPALTTAKKAGGK